MSIGTRIPWDEAYEIARQVSHKLEPAVQRSKCAGSIRRRRPDIGDVEFVIEPHYQADLVGGRYPIIDEIQKVADELGTWVKGANKMMQVTDLLGHEGLKLDLYLVIEPAQWGSILAIRTGPWKLGKYVVSKMREHGYRHRNGHAERIRGDELVPTPEEKDFFALAEVPCVAPAKRDGLLESLKRRQ